MILKRKWHWARIWPPIAPIPNILRDMWNWNLRYMNWVASIWPQSNSIFLPTLVGLKTTKESMELSKNLRESKSLKFLKITFNGGLNSMDLDLASNLLWLASNKLQEVKWMIKKLGFLEFQFQNRMRIQTRFQMKSSRILWNGGFGFLWQSLGKVLMKF